MQITPASRNPLLNWEVFCLGGGSILVWCCAWVFTDRSNSVYTVSQMAAGLAFAVNHPHFLSSYALLYKDFNRKLLSSPRHILAGVVVPVLLGGFLAYSLAFHRADLLGACINMMFFLVGWHYVKQVFGCVVVTSARDRVYLSGVERKAILANLFSLWFLSWVTGQVTSATYQFYGIEHFALGLPTFLTSASYYAVAATGVLACGLLVRKYVEEGKAPSAGGLIAWVALYIWYVPPFAHASFAYLIPFFHSLQYLVFVTSFKLNQVDDLVSALKGREQRAQWVKGVLGYFIGVTVLGAMAFEFVPKGLDSAVLFNDPKLGTSPFLAVFLLFINIHHYFIDNAIWRSSNEEVRKYLFAPSRAGVGGASDAGDAAGAEASNQISPAGPTRSKHRPAA